MKAKMYAFLALISISLGLSACKPDRTNSVTCKPASSPFANLLAINESEYWGGYYPNIEIGQVCEFEGQVIKGDIFKQEFAENLVFCLLPNEDGWEIAVTDTSQNECEENFSVFVTPPWHGENPLYIKGYLLEKWGYAESSDGVEIESGFNFVFNESDHELLRSEYHCLHWFVDCPPETDEEIIVYRSRWNNDHNQFRIRQHNTRSES